jgi:hypothetical protein
MVVKCPFYPVSNEKSSSAPRAFSRILSKLENANKIAYVWGVLGEHPNFRMVMFLQVIHNAINLPGLKTDEMSPKELEEWQREVVELCVSLANKLAGSRMDRFFIKLTDDVVERYESGSSERDRRHSKSLPKAISENRSSAVEAISEATRGGYYVSESLRRIAQTKETDEPGKYSLLDSIDILNRPTQKTAAHTRFARALTTFFVDEIGDPQRECVAIIIAAMFDCAPPPKRNIRRWAPYPENQPDS